MIKIRYLFILVQCPVFAVVAQKNYIDYVNTLQGTNSDFHLTRRNTYPTTALPYDNRI